jgi:hypothetical protein
MYFLEEFSFVGEYRLTAFVRNVKDYSVQRSYLTKPVANKLSADWVFTIMKSWGSYGSSGHEVTPVKLYFL